MKWSALIASAAWWATGQPQDELYAALFRALVPRSAAVASSFSLTACGLICGRSDVLGEARSGLRLA